MASDETNHETNDATNTGTNCGCDTCIQMRLHYHAGRMAIARGEIIDSDMDVACGICKRQIVVGADVARVRGVDHHRICWLSVRGMIERDEPRDDLKPTSGSTVPPPADDCWQEPGCRCERCMLGEAYVANMRRAGKLGPGSATRRELGLPIVRDGGERA